MGERDGKGAGVRAGGQREAGSRLFSEAAAWKGGRKQQRSNLRRNAAALQR